MNAAPIQVGKRAGSPWSFAPVICLLNAFSAASYETGRPHKRAVA
jgi:hypothetical protein